MHPFRRVLCLAVLVAHWPALAWADIDFAPALRDYGTILFLPRHELEVSVDYIGINDTLDVLDIREDALDSVNSNFRAPNLGDFNGGRLLANYGLFDQTDLQGQYRYQAIELGLTDFVVHSFELSVRQGFLAGPGGGPPLLSLTVGGRADVGREKEITDVADINRFVKRIDSRLSVSETLSHIVLSDGQVTIRAPKQGRDPLQVALEDMGDLTPFARLSLGRPFGRWVPTLFAEAGKSFIDTRFSTNVSEFLPALVASRLDAFPDNLDREEEYLKAGFSLLLLLERFVFHLGYEYTSLMREAELEAIDYNHVASGEVLYRLNETYAIGVGATYYYRQLNGEIPFLYNQFTKTAFDHEYGLVNFGLSASF